MGVVYFLGLQVPFATHLLLHFPMSLSRIASLVPIFATYCSSRALSIDCAALLLRAQLPPLVSSACHGDRTLQRRDQSPRLPAGTAPQRAPHCSGPVCSILPHGSTGENSVASTYLFSSTARSKTSIARTAFVSILSTPSTALAQIFQFVVIGEFGRQMPAE